MIICENCNITQENLELTIKETKKYFQHLVLSDHELSFKQQVHELHFYVRNCFLKYKFYLH